MSIDEDTDRAESGPNNDDCGESGGEDNATGIFLGLGPDEELGDNRFVDFDLTLASPLLAFSG